jgi:hypothetical protein
MRKQMIYFDEYLRVFNQRLRQHKSYAPGLAIEPLGQPLTPYSYHVIPGEKLAGADACLIAAEVHKGMAEKYWVLPNCVQIVSRKEKSLCTA